MERLEERQLLSTFTVTTAADSDDGTLRQAILDANANPGPDVIEFRIVGDTVIRPVDELPAITDAVTIDATTQPGYIDTPATLDGSSTRWVEIDKDTTRPPVGLTLTAGNSTIRGLWLVGWSGGAVSITDGGNNTISQNNVEAGGVGITIGGVGSNKIQGNHFTATYENSIVVGSDRNVIAGNVIAGAYDEGIRVQGDGTVIQGNRIDGCWGIGILVSGADTTITGNLIANNLGNGIQFSGASGVTLVSGNTIGLDEAGLAAPNQGNGVAVTGATGPFRVEGNTIGGNSGDGVRVEDSSGVVIVGNTIRQNAAGGVYILGASTDNVVGGLGAGEANTITGGSNGVILDTAGASAHDVVQGNVIWGNYANGVWVIDGTGNEMTQNSIYGNGNLGIELGQDRVTLNDSAGHAGPNLYQNFPVISSATVSAGTLFVSGTLSVVSGDEGKSYRIEVFASELANPSQYGEGQTYVGSAIVEVDAGGNAAFSVSGSIPDNQTIVTATATDEQGNTSEFSKAFRATASTLQPATSTALASSSNPAALGQLVIFTATVSAVAGAGTPTGVVTFMDESATLGSGTLSDGVATFATSSLAAGSHTITAVYAGDGNFQPSVSDPLTQQVNAVFSVAGVTFKDMTGNGASSDDAAMGDVTVLLFADVNGNDKLDSGDGAAVANTVSDATGTYRFDNVAPGRYFIQEVAPAGFVRTVPLTSDYYAVTATPGGSATGLDFYNAFPCPDRGDVFNMVYIINGTTTVTDLRGNVHQGDTVEARFQLPADATVRLTLVSYTAPDSTFDASEASQQQIWESQTGLFSEPSPTGYYSLKVNVPDTYFQIDFVCGYPIDHFGPADSNIFYSAQDRLYSADNGGTRAYTADSSSISGFVYLDSDNDGIREAGESAIVAVTVKLSGADSQGRSVNATTTTDSRGRYAFANVPAGTYQVAEIQPAGYTDGKETLGTGGGSITPDGFAGIVIDPHQGYTDYNFGELRQLALRCGDTATIGFWRNKNGQALIKSLNGRSTSTALGNWLAKNFPRLYGVGPNNTAGMTNVGVANLFTKLFNMGGQKLDAQVLAVALAVYATDSDLAGAAASPYGFMVSTTGTGARAYNVGANGRAFGVANNATMTVMDILQAADARAVKGALYNGDTTLRNMANTVFDGINQQGDIA